MIDADRVREVTQQVLEQPAYRDIPGSPWARIVEAVRSWFATLLDGLLGSSAAGWVGQAIGLAVVLLVLGLLVLAVVGLRRRSAADLVVDSTSDASLLQLLAEADAHREAGRVEDAVRARYGAVVVLLVERGVLLARPGTTVGEVDEVVGLALPEAAAQVRLAGRALAEVVYGHRPASTTDDDTVTAAFEALRSATDVALSSGPSA